MRIFLRFSRVAAFVVFSLLILHDANAQFISVSIAEQTSSCRNDGSASLTVTGGTAPYNIVWTIYRDGGMDTVATGLSASGLADGYYQIRVEDSSVPTVTTYSSVWIRPTFDYRSNTTPENCSDADGKIVITVLDSGNTVGPYSFEWSNGVNTFNTDSRADSITGLGTGSYYVKITDGNGCINSTIGGITSQEGFYIWSNSTVQASATATPSNCADGTATINVTDGAVPPYTYQWATSPVQTTQIASGLAPGFYNATVTDSLGCSRIVYVTVPAGPNYLQVNASIQPALCNENTGAIFLNVTGGLPPYSYQWSNGESAASISGLSTGTYNVVITDSLDCSIQLTKYVPVFSPVAVNISGTSPGCGQSNGELVAQVTGGEAPYTYDWYPAGPNSATFSNLAKGNYYLTVEDANGCKGQQYFSLKEPEACRVKITGRVWNDLNANCTGDNVENGIAGVLVKAMPGPYYATTGADGTYSFSLEAGEYTISVLSPERWTQVCPSDPATYQVQALSPGTSYGGNNFYLQPDSVFNDLAVFVSSGRARPGFDLSYYVSVYNRGTTPVSGTLRFQHDSVSSFLQANPPAVYNSANRELTWVTLLLNPQQSATYRVDVRVGLSAELGDSLRSRATISLAGADANPENNSNYYAILVTGSYDPNDKAVSPGGIGDEGFILESDSILSYRIRFQNTGTDTAFTVVVRDTLDELVLDPGTFRFIGASHEVEYDLSDKNILTFTFNNILLPDSNVNEPGSHGLIDFLIHRRRGLPTGTEIRNTASIYFDYNKPITTNTTLNTLYDSTVGLTRFPSPVGMNILSNPTKDFSSLKIDAVQELDAVVLEIVDVSGRTVLKEWLGTIHAGIHRIPLSSAGLISGTYFVRLNTASGATYGSVKWMILR